MDGNSIVALAELLNPAKEDGESDDVSGLECKFIKGVFSILKSKWSLSVVYLLTTNTDSILCTTHTC